LVASLALALPGAALANDKLLPAPFVGVASPLPTTCNYAAGECDFVVDPSTDVCFIPGGDPDQPTATFLIKGKQLLAFDWPWGADPSADHAIFGRMKNLYFNAVSGNWQKTYEDCDRELVNSTGRALGVYAWLTRDELDSLAAQGLYLGYAGVPQDELPQEETPASVESANRSEVGTATLLRAKSNSRAVLTSRVGKAKPSVKPRSTGKNKAAAKPKRPAVKKRAR
jgi:hypothetical protein